jgi:LicD family protein
MWDQLIQGFIYMGMPVVLAYHLTCGNVFLNTAAEDATGFEKAGNIFLTPAQYLLNAKTAHPIPSSQGQYVLEQRFDYHNHLPLKSTFSIISLPFTLPIGCLLKGISYMTESGKSHHKAIVASIESTDVHPNIDYYRSLGLVVIDEVAESTDVPQFKRRPGEENVLQLEKVLLAQISQLFNENQIPFWVDCGTCLGTHRYGGAIPWDKDIDVAVLCPDFDNVMHALNKLDKTKYHVQDWSNRCRPKTYIRVYIRENHNHLDIYHFAIDPETKTVRSILSNEISEFMLESWKIHERRFTIPTAYETVFPLKKAKFDGIEVYVPNQTKKYLQERYGDNIGPVKVYNETSGEYEKDLSHPYWQLPHAY